MASGLSLEILDLRHFAAPMLRPVLEAESAIWRERLNWDYLASAKLLLHIWIHARCRVMSRWTPGGSPDMSFVSTKIRRP